jgi:hypothetical protein
VTNLFAFSIFTPPFAQLDERAVKMVQTKNSPILQRPAEISSAKYKKARVLTTRAFFKGLTLFRQAADRFIR